MRWPAAGRDWSSTHRVRPHFISHVMSCRIALAEDQPVFVRLGILAIGQVRPNEYVMRSMFIYTTTATTMIITAAVFMFNIGCIFGRDRGMSSGMHHYRGRHPAPILSP